MSHKELPVEVVKQINEQADKFGFVVPYDGSNKFYNDDKVEGYKAGATAYATQLHQLQQENAKLRRQNDKLKEQATGWRPLLEDVLREDRRFGSVSKSTIDKLTKFLYGE